MKTEYYVDDILKEAEEKFGLHHNKNATEEEIKFILSKTDYEKGFRFEHSPQEFLDLFKQKRRENQYEQEQRIKKLMREYPYIEDEEFIIICFHDKSVCYYKNTKEVNNGN